MRYMMLLSMITFSTVVLIDIGVHTLSLMMIFLRFVIFPSVFSIILGLSFTKLYKKYYIYLNSFLALFAGIMVNISIAIVPEEFHLQYLDGLYIVIIFVCVLIHLEFLFGLITTGFAVLIHFIIDYFTLSQTFSPLYWGQILYLFVTWCIANFGSYILDYTTRENFWEKNYRDIIISELKIEIMEAHEKLLHSQKMDSIGRLAGGIAHDYNNYLTVIMGYSEVLIENIIDTEEEKKEIYEKIFLAAQNSSKLTKQLLTFARKAKFNPVIINPNTAISQAIKLAKSIFKETDKINIKTHLDDSVRKIFVDETQFSQMMLNLMINARDAMPHGGNLIISTSNVEIDKKFNYKYSNPLNKIKIGSYIEITIEDTGVGMDEDTQNHIFEPFFTTKGEKGTGLGLATIFGIVKTHEGQINFHSKLGEGTTFQIYFPATNHSNNTRNNYML